VVGGDTDHGSLPWLVSSPAIDNFKCTPVWELFYFIYFYRNKLFEWLQQ